MVGRIDQFVVGMLACHYARHAAKRHLLAGVGTVSFTFFLWWFDLGGGFYDFPNQRLWVVLPTIEAAFYGLLVAYYDQTCTFSSSGRLSRFVALLGKYSYSIYLLGPWMIFLTRSFWSRLPQDNVDLALVVSIAAFPLMLPVGFASYKLIEEPFLRLRRPYTRAAASASGEEPAAQEIAS